MKYTILSIIAFAGILVTGSLANAQNTTSKVKSIRLGVFAVGTVDNVICSAQFGEMDDGSLLLISPRHCFESLINQKKESTNLYVYERGQSDQAITRPFDPAQVATQIENSAAMSIVL